jgi:hypothetical protein
MSKREYVAMLHGPIVRRRSIIEVEQGEISAFCVQLEFNHSPAVDQSHDWRYIARFDHKPENMEGHDIREEGLHMDLHHPKQHDRTYTGFPPVPLEDAPGFAADHFDERYLEICERYLEWCETIDESWMAILPLPR